VVFDIVTIVVCLAALLGPWFILWCRPPDDWRTWYVQEGALGTLLQVIPATIVAVFVFAVGAIFVMTQIIGPTLGSRAIEALLIRRRARACTIAGVVILLAGLGLTTFARIGEESGPYLWEAAAASSLALASFIYIPAATLSIVRMFYTFVSPRAYSDLLSQPRKWKRPLTSELAYERLRALRQWLRTACRTGESRDLVFALLGFEQLLGYYCKQVRKAQNKKYPNDTLRKETPAEYDHTGAIVNSRWLVLLDPSGAPPSERYRVGWFGDEFGRALARGAEVGIKSGLLLRRDLDRLLVVLGGATLQLAGFVSPDKEATSSHAAPLAEEANFLVDRIAEIGMYAYQVQDKAYSDWFRRPAIVLAGLEEKLEGIDARTSYPPLPKSSLHNGERKHAHNQGHCLAGRSLAAWCLLNYVLYISEVDRTTKGDIPAHGWRQLGEQARKSKEGLWDEAKLLALNSAIHPSWLPSIYEEPKRQERIEKFLNDIHIQVLRSHLTENDTTLVDESPTSRRAQC
jgi:hypothetical protein